MRRSPLLPSSIFPLVLTLPSSLWSLMSSMHSSSFHSPVFLFPWPSGSGLGVGGNHVFPTGGVESFGSGPPGALACCPSGPLGRPRPPRIEPRAPRSEPRASKSDPRPPQDPEGTAQDRSRAAQDPPRAAQDHPKRSQERPKSLQERPRGGQDLKNRYFSLCFSMLFENSISATKTAG